MFFIGRIQFEYEPTARFDHRTWFSEFGSLPFNSQLGKIYELPFLDQYIHSLY